MGGTATATVPNVRRVAVVEVTVGAVGIVGAVFQQVTVQAVGAVQTVEMGGKFVKKKVERMVKGLWQDTLMVVKMVDKTVGVVQAAGVVGIVEKVVNGLVEKEIKELLEMLRKQEDTALLLE